MFSTFLDASHALEAMKAFNTSHAMIEFDLDGTIIDANDSFCRTMGYSREEIVGKHHTMFVDPARARSQAYQDFWAALRKGECQKRQFKRLRKGGQVAWLEASYNPLMRRGKPYRILKIATDITAAKVAEMDARGKIEALSRAQAVIEFTPDGKIVHANPNFLSALGYALEDVVGRHHSIFCTQAYAQSREYREFWEKLARGEYQNDQFTRLKKDGSEIFIQATYNPILDDEGQVLKVVKFATDVTARVTAFNALAQGLERLADCNLRMTIDEPFGDGLDHLRGYYNQSIGEFQETLAKVLGEARSLSENSDVLHEAAASLGHRTEQQAAALEQASAALEQITVTVRQTAASTDDTRKLVKDTRQSASQSMTVVDETIGAMQRIETASKEIANIIDVIDEIAFQTNLLALNAGIEAARAGEAGRGFAVVAQEVRELAQRTSAAAHQITGLIRNSATQVSQGVGLVSQTGDALKAIEAMVGTIDDNVDNIATAAREQSSTLAEITSAINELDRTTQSNAEVVGSNERISLVMRDGVARLVALAQRFKLNRRNAIREPGSRAADCPEPRRSAA